MLYADYEGITFLTAHDVTVTAVPEPSAGAMALAALAGGGYSLFRRRKRASREPADVIPASGP